jgi:glycosyltransferase involved in cell wall biosynthesis
MIKVAKLTILIPVYNEEESINELYSRISAVMKKNSYKYELIWVDDGSTDKTLAEIIKTAKDRNVRYISFQKNYGKSAAFMAGFEMAEGDYLVTMDGDLQDEPAEIPNLIKKLEEGYDLVSGWKFKRKDPLDKTIPSRIFNAVLRSSSGVKIHDFNCGLKIYRKSVYKKIEVYGTLYRFIPALAGWMGFKVTELKVDHHPRKYGHSKFGAGRFMVGLLDFFTVVFLNRYLKSPLHIFGLFGLIFMLGGLVIAGFVLYLRIATGTIQGRTPLFLGGLGLIFIGMQFLSLGFLGEIIVKTAAKRGDQVIKRKH